MSTLVGVVVALFVFVVTQSVLKFVIEPIQDQRRLIGEVAHALSMRYYLVDVHREGVEEVRRTLRSLSGRLWASLWAIPFYDVLALIGAVPKMNYVIAAAAELRRWSYLLTSPDPGDSITRSIFIIAEHLDITIRVARPLHPQEPQG